MVNSLLLVDDEPNVSKSLSRLLRRDQYEIYTANSAEEALDILERHTIKVVIADQRMPHMTGSQLLARIKKQYPETLRIIISGYSDFEAISEAINEGEIYRFLSKPWNSKILRSDVRNAFQTQALRQHNRQLSQLFDSTIEAIVLTDPKGIIEAVNPAFSQLSKFASEDVLGLPLRRFFVSPSDEPLEENLMTEEADKEWHGELICKKNGGEELPVWLSFMKITGPYEEPHYAALFIDITEQKRKEARIEYQAYHDELTGLPNRRLFSNHLELALHQHERHKHNFGVLFLDLDRFKTINDTLGHEVGDELLKAVAVRLLTVVRKCETLARFGGDEFVLLLPVLRNMQECEVVAQKIIDCLREPFNCSGNTVYMSTSIGISLPLNDAQDTQTLMRHADSAMYRAKALGGNNFQFFDKASNTKLKKLLQTENALHKSIENDEFIPFFQPQVDPQTGLICGCEALVRWQHPEEGIISPGSFIDVAEHTGLILPIGRRVLQQACEQLAYWQYQRKLSCNLSVNLSALQFNDANLLHDIRQLVVTYRLDPQWLELEVTESVLLTDIDSSIRILSTLRDMGLRIALDDFGTGYSSLSYLKQLPIDTLKIDQSFVRELPDDRKSCVITRSMLKMAKELGLSVVAEGVETKAQLDFLRREGCDLIQGYLFSPPIASESFIGLASTHCFSEELAL
jgi:diguanylate cyclase (GGDEF)-like protein/PAS domain S-box-containing protein